MGSAASRTYDTQPGDRTARARPFVVDRVPQTVSGHGDQGPAGGVDPHEGGPAGSGFGRIIARTGSCDEGSHSGRNRPTSCQPRFKYKLTASRCPATTSSTGAPPPASARSVARASSAEPMPRRARRRSANSTLMQRNSMIGTPSAAAHMCPSSSLATDWIATWPTTLPARSATQASISVGRRRKCSGPRSGGHWNGYCV